MDSYDENNEKYKEVFEMVANAKTGNIAMNQLNISIIKNR